MSVAGIQSNRGDYFQKLVAFDWLITVTTDENYEWLEVDSSNYAVDDIVIKQKDGTIIYCQCKKNQPRHSAWTLADLKDELLKAIEVLTHNPTAKIRFYSRSPFAQLQSLADWATTQSNVQENQENTPKNHQSTLNELRATLPTDTNVFQLLKQLVFVVEPDDATMKERIIERLKQLVTYPDRAYGVLWLKIEQHSARVFNSGNDCISHGEFKYEVQRC